VTQRNLDGALRLAALALRGPCEVGWLDPAGEPTSVCVGEICPASWAWLAHGDAVPPDGVAPLYDSDGRLLGGVRSGPGPVSEELSALAPDLAAVLAATLRDRDRLAAHSALLEVSSQLHAEELTTDKILRLIVESAQRLISVDVTWIGLIDNQNRVAVRAAFGANSPAFVDMWIDVGRGVGGLAVKERRTVVVADHRQFEHASSDLVIKTIGEEGIVSVLCAPLIHDGRPIGALYGGSRRPSAFSDTTTAVFTALAAQAATSIVNSRLYGSLAEKNDLLERTLSSHRRLDAAALAGADIHAIAGEVARLIGRPIVMVNESGRHVAWRYDSQAGTDAVPEPIDPAAIKACCGEAVVRAREERLGVVGVIGDAELSAFDRNALEQGATIMALQLVKERAEWEVEWRLRGELLDELLQQQGEAGDGLLARAARFGIDLESAWAMAVLEPMPEATADIEPIVRSTLRTLTREGLVLVARRGGRTLVALKPGAGSPEEIVERVMAKARGSRASAYAGLSAAHVDIRLALAEAEAVLRLARSNRRTGLATVASLGPLRHFLNAPGTADMLAMVRAALGPVAQYDRKGNADLLHTLAAFVRSGGHHPTAAAACHIHSSTLKYRLGRITTILERSLTDPRTQFELMLAFATLDALRSLGVDEDEVFAPGA